MTFSGVCFPTDGDNKEAKTSAPLLIMIPSSMTDVDRAGFMGRGGWGAAEISKEKGHMRSPLLILLHIGHQ